VGRGGVNRTLDLSNFAVGTERKAGERSVSIRPTNRHADQLDRRGKVEPI